MIIVGMVRICRDQRGVRKRRAWGLEKEDDPASARSVRTGNDMAAFSFSLSLRISGYSGQVGWEWPRMSQAFQPYHRQQHKKSSAIARLAWIIGCKVEGLWLRQVHAKI